MRIGLILLGLLIAAGVGLFAFDGGVSVGPVFSVCSRDAEIPEREREAIVRAGQDFLAHLRAGDVAAIRQMLSSEAEDVVSDDALPGSINAARSDGAREFALDEVFSLYAPLGSREAMSICSDVDRPAMMSRHGGARTALAVFTQPLESGERTWTIYFERERGAWRVRHFHLGPSALGELDGERFRSFASAQASAGHSFNSTLLFEVAAALLERGESFEPSEAYGLVRDRSEPHPDLATGAPYTLELGGQRFAVRLIHVIVANDNALVLILEQASDQPAATEEAIARNHVLIDAMNAHRPEWRDAFGALVAAYPTGGNSAWRTVYDRDDGYLPPRDDGAASP